MKTLRENFLVPMHQSIAGMGLTTLRRLEVGENLGITHIEDDRFDDGFIRTYTGALINHSEEPNTEYDIVGEVGSRILWLVTTEVIHPGKELTIKYGEVKEL